MPQPRFITSLGQLGAPGVYVMENQPITPVAGTVNRVVAIAGECVRGPVNKAVVCTSYQRFVDVFGLRDHNSNGGSLLGKVWWLLQGKRWGKLVIVRAAAAAATKASFTVETAAGGAGTPIATITAYGPGIDGNQIQFRVLPATSGIAGQWNLSIKLYGKTYLYQNLDTGQTVAGTDNTNKVIGNDDATLIRITKLADGRPVNNAPTTDGADSLGYTFLGQTVAGFTSVAAVDGSIADTDFTATGGPMETINNYSGAHVCLVAGRSNSVIKTKIQTLAAVANLRVWLSCPDNETVTVASAVTERAAFTISDRHSYWFNHPYMIDTITLEEIVAEPHGLVASILSQTAQNVHPGDVNNATLTKQVTRLYNELANTDRDTADAAGVSFLNRDTDNSGQDIVIPGNALTCDLNSNNIDLDGRYQKDFLLIGMAQRIKGDQFKGNTPRARSKRRSQVSGWLEALAAAETYVLRNDAGVAQYVYQNDGSVNNAADQQGGLQKELAIIQLIAKNKILLLMATIGVNATVTQQ